MSKKKYSSITLKVNDKERTVMFTVFRNKNELP